MAVFPFTDLHSFKDYVAFVRMCAPNNFPEREGVSAEHQWSLDLAFKGLTEGLSYLQRDAVEICQKLLEESYHFYKVGDRKSGFLKLEEVRKLLAKHPYEEQPRFN